MVKQVSTVLTFLIALAPWGIAAWFGQEFVIYAWLLAITPGVVAKLILGWWVVKKKIVDIKFPLFQMFGATLLALIPLFLFTMAMNSVLLVLFEISEILFYLVAGLTLIGYFFIFPAFITFPLISFFGGFDKRSLDHFENAMRISGPSKKLVKLMYNASIFGYEKSPLKEKFVIPYEKADKEALELTKIRKSFVQD